MSDTVICLATPLLLGQQLDRGARLVNHVNGLVGQEAVADVLGGQFSGGGKDLVAVGDAVVGLVMAPQPVQDAFRIRHGRLVDVDLLKPPAEGLVTLEGGFVFGEGGRTDAAQFAAGQSRFEQVRGVHHAAFNGAGAHDGVDFVDKQDGPRFVAQGFEHGLEALLELAAVLGAGDQGAHIQGVHLGVAERFRDLAALNLEGQTLGDSGLADAGLADVDRVVLAAAAQHLDGALDFRLAPDERVDAVLRGQFDQIDRKGR